MKTQFFASILLLTCVNASAAWSTQCSTIKRVDTWANGSDSYGVRVSLNDNPSSCDGFWVEHAASNKDLVYSLLLSSQIAKRSVCIQYDSEHQKHHGACRLNKVNISQ